MRHKLAILAGTLVVVAAPAAAAPTAGTPPALLVIQVKSVEAGTKLDDNPPQGISKGDRLHERSRLLNVKKQFGKPAGAVVGRDETLVTLIAGKTGRVAGTATLPGGTIRFGGVVRLDTPPTIPVIGGTGRYAKARGTLIIGDGDSPLNTYHLRLPAKGGGTVV
jgi:hypothetical protein